MEEMAKREKDRGGGISEQENKEEMIGNDIRRFWDLK